MNKQYLGYLLLFGVLIAFYGCHTSHEDSPKSFSSSSEDRGGGVGSSAGAPGNQSQAGVITAAEWRDQDNWDFWENLWQSDDYFSAKEIWEFNLENRYAIQVLDKNDLPFSNIDAVLIDQNDTEIWRAKTDNQGRAELWKNFLSNGEKPEKIQLSYDGIHLGTFAAQEFDDRINVLRVDAGNPYHQDLDIYFVVDATGSMGDELEYLKTELLDVINRVKSNHIDLDVRLGAAFYRDEKDDYLVRDFPLTENVQSVIDEIKQQSADGGGDFPEAVHSGLKSAIAHQNWSKDAISRLVFLILDAPPHDDQKVKSELEEQIIQAAKQGVKIIPIVASGINKETEFLMRYFALATNGTYVFITDDSGIGNAHLEPTVGDFEVELLNELIIRLIEEYSAQ